MPSPASLAEQALKALGSQDYAQAINLYTQALKQTPESPDYYIKRSTAYQRSSNYACALEDAEMAVVLAHKRGKRELISSAQLRRGISLLMEGRIGDAGFCFGEAERKAVGEKEKNVIGVWKKKLELQLAKIDEDDVRLEVTVREIPDVTVAAPKEVKPSSSETVPSSSSSSPPPLAAAAAAAPAKPAGVSTPVSRIRHEWYQTATHVVLTVYVKGVPKDKATIEIEKNSVAIAFPMPTGSEFRFDVCPLYDEVDPTQSSFSILSTKIEVKLAKGTAGRKWADLEAPEQTPAAPAPEVKAEQPAYPTSSKTGPKDWDKVAKELSSRPKKTKGKGAEGAGEEQELESDDEEGDPVSHFFKKLYKDADEDTRRAMMKSYVESNGTALSTNWKEVGKAPVETSPPAGMIAKNWGS